MIDFATLKTGIGTLVATLTGLQPIDVEQDPGANSWGQVKARWSLIGWAGLGVDDSTFDRVEPFEQANGGEVPFGGQSAPLRETVSGRRTFTLRIKVVTYDHTGEHEAETYIERARSRLRWQSVTTFLNTLGLGFSGVLGYGSLNDTVDDRVSSTAYVDVSFSIHARETDPTEYASIDYADEVSIKRTP